MSYTALYRKFRPAEFEDVKGQDHIITTLKNQIKADRIGHAYLFCGTRGTGKTTVVQQSVKALEKDEKNVLIAATTGVAADNIGMGAVTVHKAFGLGIEFEKYKDAPGFRSSYLQEADVVIIDEIGMCRFDLFSAIVKNIIAENNKRLELGYSCNGKKKNAVQLIVVGDFFQLPPVIKKEDREILVEMYGTEYEQGEICERGYAFFSRAWKEMELRKVRRSLPSERCRISWHFE